MLELAIKGSEMASSDDAIPEHISDQFYSAELGGLPFETQQVLGKYSKIPPDEVRAHVHVIVS